MKKIILSLLPLFSLSAIGQTGNDPAFKMPDEIKFERVIEQKMGMDGKERKVTYYFTATGDYAAINPEQKDGKSLIIYTKDGNMLMVNDKDKSIIVMNMTKFMTDAMNLGKEMADNRKDKHPQKDSVDKKTGFSKTGKTKTICGYPAEEYEVKNEKGTMSVWYLKTDFDTQLISTMGMGKMFDQSKASGIEVAGNNTGGVPFLNKNYFMAEMEKNGQKSIETTSITKTDFTFSANGYTIKDMKYLMKGKFN